MRRASRPAALAAVLVVMTVAAVARAEAPADPADDGRQALRDGDYERAAARLAVAVEQSPGRLDLQRDYGLALLLLRRYDEACRTLGAVADAAPSDVATVRAQALCEELRRRPSRFHLLAEVGFQYDSNVVLDPLAPAPGGGAARTVARLVLKGRVLARAPSWIDATAEYYQSVHFNDRAALSLFDVSAPEGRLAAGVATRRVAASVEGRWRETWTDMYRVHYGREVEGEGRVDATVAPGAVTALCYRLRMLRFFDVNLPGPDDRDALQQEVGIEQRFAFGRRVPLVSGYAAYVRNEADGDNFDFHAARVAALMRVLLARPLTLELLAAYTYRDFVNASPSREDHQIDGAIAASWAVHRNVSLLLGYQHTVNRSTVAADRYQRAVVSFMVRGEL